MQRCLNAVISDILKQKASASPVSGFSAFPLLKYWVFRLLSGQKETIKNVTLGGDVLIGRLNINEEVSFA